MVNNIKSFADNIWSLFISVKLTLSIIGLICLASIIGSLPKYNATPEENIEELSRLFGESAGPEIFKVLDTFGLIDIFHTWWFIALLVLLAVNIIICSLNRLPGILQTIRTPLQPLSLEKVEEMPIRRSILLNGEPDEVKEFGLRVLKKAGFKASEVQTAEGRQFYSQKGAWSRFGVYITHISILVILAGAIIGMLFSSDSYISLPEGDVSSVVYPLPDSGETAPIPLGFEIRADNFEVDFYGDTDTAKLYESKVTVLENGKEVLSKTITVNDPLIYKNLTFLLSDYGVVPRRLNRGTFIFKVTTKDAESSEVRLTPGSRLRIPNTSITGKIINFSPALIHDDNGNLSTYTEKLHNPAVHIEFSDSEERLYSNWIFKRYPETSLLPDGNRVEFVDYWGVEYTFFRVKSDPGLWLVYIGMITMVVGILIAFFLSHKKVWVHFVEEGVNTRVVIGATANKNKEAFEKKIAMLRWTRSNAKVAVNSVSPDLC